MPNATVGDVVTRARRLLNESSSAGRFSDAALIGWVDDASRFLNRDILFPKAQWLFQSVAGQGAYGLEPAVLKEDAVYVNGQLSAPVDGGQNALEGITSGTYNQDAQNLSYAPVWTQEQPGVYPGVNSEWGYAPSGTVAMPGERPRHFWDGGYLVLVPATLVSGAWIQVRGVAIVPSLKRLADITMFPDAMAAGLAWKVVEFAKFSDDTDRASEGRNYAASQYDREMREWRMWNRRRGGPVPHAPVVRTNRSVYVRGNHRSYGG